MGSLSLICVLAVVSARANAVGTSPPEYVVTAAPITVGAPHGDLCVAVDLKDPNGVWWWEPGASGCSTRSTGPGVFHGEAASVSSAKTPGVTEVRFSVGLIGPTGGAARGPLMEVLVLLDRGGMRVAATGSKVSTISRTNLEVPGFDGVPENRPRTAQLPANVMSALTARFPRAKIEKWTREKEEGKAVYDIEFTQAGKKFEADILADGAIHNWEQQVAASDLPAAVAQTVARQFPHAGMKEIMAVTAVTNGNERLEGYEIVVQRSRKRDVEMTVAPDGKVLEGPGKEK
jgi:hypothetical protein